MSISRTSVWIVLSVVLVATGASVTARAQSPSEAAALAAELEAANQGDPDAQSLLGTRFLLGDGVPRDDAQAVMWWRKAADQGLANAQSNLGYLYLNGRGVRTDYGEALAWYLKAAQQGNVQALKDLGVMYYKGQGVPQDFIEAHKWYNLAASRVSAGFHQAYALGRDEIAQKMTPAQVAEAQRLAHEWQVAFEQRPR